MWRRAEGRENSVVVARSAAKLTYEDYRKTPEDERYELLDGDLVTAAAPNIAHQRISGRLGRCLAAFVEEKGLGEVFRAPTDVVLSDTDVVQPDILFVSGDRADIITADDVQGAPDLVVEVLSPATARRDWRVKLDLYSMHGVREYWLADPETEIVWVLLPKEGNPKVTAIYGKEDTLTSPMLKGFSLDLDQIFPG